jgi:DNA-binding phage protein
MHTGKTTKPAPASLPFRAADYLRSDKDIAAYIEAMLEDGDPRAIPIALRTVADALGASSDARKRGSTGCAGELVLSTGSQIGFAYHRRPG